MRRSTGKEREREREGGGTKGKARQNKYWKKKGSLDAQAEMTKLSFQLNFPPSVAPRTHPALTAGRSLILNHSRQFFPLSPLHAGVQENSVQDLTRRPLYPAATAKAPKKITQARLTSEGCSVG